MYCNIYCSVCTVIYTVVYVLAYFNHCRFLIEATKCLENHLGSEGLFRKSGSSVRQRQLKVGILDLHLQILSVN